MGTRKDLSIADVNQLTRDMAEACDRVLELFGTLGEDQLWGPELDIVNPATWEAGHVAWFFEYWLLRNLYETQMVIPDADDLYNSADVAHDDRWKIRLPSKTETMQFLQYVLGESTRRLRTSTPTTVDAYFFRLATFHADMHAEAFSYTRQTLGYRRPSLNIPKVDSVDMYEGTIELAEDIPVSGGVFMLGASPDEAFVFDNEKWAHPVYVPPFTMSRTSVTYGEFRQFVEDRGYDRPEFWSEEGWSWRVQNQADRPAYWIKHADGQWLIRSYDEVIPMPDNATLIHINWYEASAYCSWAGRRLPTEAEWEFAASFEPSSNDSNVPARKRRFPWGNEAPTPGKVNMDWTRGGTIDPRFLPDGDSALGFRQMIGNVWEWTSTNFYPFPGFSPDPYKEYSEPWFGDHMVLRGGAWSTRSRLIRNTWRNFYKPDRRDVMAGFRTCKVDLPG